MTLNPCLTHYSQDHLGEYRAGLLSVLGPGGDYGTGPSGVWQRFRAVHGWLLKVVLRRRTSVTPLCASHFSL